jgi:SAM-dependent methyltransferase
MNIPNKYLARENSERANVLYHLFKPYFFIGMRVLDICCGRAPLAGYIKEDFGHNVHYLGFDKSYEAVKQCQTDHPYYRWRIVGDIYFENINVILNIGIPSIFNNNILEIHKGLLKREKSLKTIEYCFLEAGDFKKDNSDPVRAMLEIIDIYLNHSFKIILGGMFILQGTGFPVPKRYYAVLKNDNI